MAATWYVDDSPHPALPDSQPSSAAAREQVTDKAGENGQCSGEMGGSSPWTRPSAPGCGDRSKASASFARSEVGTRATWLRGRYRTGSRLVVLH